MVSFVGVLSGWATYAGNQREVKERRAAKERARILLQSDMDNVKQAVQQLKTDVQRVEQAVQQSRWEQRAVQLGLIMLLAKAYYK